MSYQNHVGSGIRMEPEPEVRYVTLFVLFYIDSVNTFLGWRQAARAKIGAVGEWMDGWSQFLSDCLIH